MPDPQRLFVSARARRARAPRGTPAHVQSCRARAPEPDRVGIFLSFTAARPSRRHALPRRNTFYQLAWRVVSAINAGLDEEMRFPINDEPALNKLEARFRERWGINSAYLYKGCVGTIDGLVIKINRPSKTMHKCPQAFYCGRYNCFGIAFQVIVGPDCEFLWSYGNAPGSVHDSVAFGMSRLYSKLRAGQMDAKYHLAGDGAYCDESWLFTPYPEPRSGKLSADKDAFNWVHSSHRQCVERAFGARRALRFTCPLACSQNVDRPPQSPRAASGMLVGRWLILERVQKYHHTKVESVVHACMRLQNVCIQRRQEAPSDDGVGRCETRTSRAFAGSDGKAPTFMFTSAIADANFAGLRTAAGRNADKKAKITKNLADAHIRRPS